MGAGRRRVKAPRGGPTHGHRSLSAKGRTDVPAITGEDDAAHEGTALRHVAELDAQAPALDDGRDLALADRPVLAPFLTAKLPSGGALDVLVVAHPDAEPLVREWSHSTREA